MTRYEIDDYVGKAKPGQAVIEAFFTAKGKDVYAIVPGWPGKKLVLKDMAKPSAVSMLGKGAVE
ncbi:hypothetical protein ABTK33_20485, partial [Acinetobacter baumannii]